MKKKLLKLDLWFNKKIGWFLTNGRKYNRLTNLINSQEEKLSKWQD